MTTPPDLANERLQSARSTAAEAVDGEARSAVRADVLDSISSRVLWLAVRMIHEANSLRPNPDGLKVGGHPASSASAAAILTALYFYWLRPADLVSIKPHASPAYHAVRYLLGQLDASYLSNLRAFGGLQSYPSRAKDPDRVDFTTGSVGLGAVAPLFAALADRYARFHFCEEASSWPDRRFVALVGDAELDEGSVSEAIFEEQVRGLGNVTIIVDLNRQSLDRLVPGIRVSRLRGMFAAADWQVIEAKYGRHLQALFAHPGGFELRRRIDEMSNEEYQVLIRRPGAEARERLVGGARGRDRDALARSVQAVKDDALPAILGDLGGHDIPEIVRALAAADSDNSRPSVVFAYTVKGWRLPFAGDSMNHSALLTEDQVRLLAGVLGADPDDPWATFPPGSPEGRLCAERGAQLGAAASPHGLPAMAGARPAMAIQATADDPRFRIAPRTSTQQVFGETLGVLAREPDIAKRLVTASPDVSVSTSLGGWINRVGVFSCVEEPVYDEKPKLLKWAPGPMGQHVELGLSEMNFFMWLSQFGLSAELLGEPLVPIGTVYDPFICRGLDALIYGLYSGSRFILVGTPSGLTLAPEGASHQSSITPSIGIELPGLTSYEPAFGWEVVWCLLEAIRGCQERSSGFCTYLRLSTRVVDQALAELVRSRLGETEWRRQTLSGGYRLMEAREHAPGLSPHAPTVNIIATGSVVTEAVAAVRALAKEDVAANLIVVTSAERLAAELHDSGLRAIRTRTRRRLGHLETLLPASERATPIVTVHDGASHALTFLGGVFGAPVVPLGVDVFGQSGAIGDLYSYSGIDEDHIVKAAFLAVDAARRES